MSCNRGGEWLGGVSQTVQRSNSSFSLRQSHTAAMEEAIPCSLPILDNLIPLLSLLFFVGDVVLDAWAVVSLYEEKEYVYMGLLIFLLLGSSVLLQIFSWIWYSESSTDLQSRIEKFMKQYGYLPLVHVCQLGVFLRFAGVIEISIHGSKQNDSSQNDGPKSDESKSDESKSKLKFDLSVLQLFEAFSESAPQLTLMVVIILHMQELQLFTVIKLLGSFLALSFSMLSHHYRMRDLISDKTRMGWSSSIIYFLWNLLLIGPRVACLSLFASVLPFYIAAHFLFLWMLLVFWAWLQKTDFMDSIAAEWLYRATVGIIWYFSWFNAAGGSTKSKAIFYHVAMGMDMVLLLGLWWWKRSVESAHRGPLLVSPQVLIATLPLVYITGLVLKVFYYWKFHPNKTDSQKNKNPLLPGAKSIAVLGEGNTDTNKMLNYYMKQTCFCSHVEVLIEESSNTASELCLVEESLISREGPECNDSVITESVAATPEPSEGFHFDSMSDLVETPEPNRAGPINPDPIDVGIATDKECFYSGKFSEPFCQQSVAEFDEESLSFRSAREFCKFAFISESSEGFKLQNVISDLSETPEPNPAALTPTLRHKVTARFLKARDPQGHRALQESGVCLGFLESTVMLERKQEPGPVVELNPSLAFSKGTKHKPKFRFQSRKHSRGMPQPDPAITGIRKRMRTMANNFYG